MPLPERLAPLREREFRLLFVGRLTSRAAAWGLIVSAGAAGFVVGGLVCLRLRPERYLLVGTARLLLLALPLLALATHQPTAVVAAAA